MFHYLRIETEIGFVAGKRITQKLENINALQNLLLERIKIHAMLAKEPQVFH